jgi:chemotaxis protein methyltransferase CheR
MHPAPAVPVLPAPDPVPRLLRDLVHERTGVFFEDDRLPGMLEKLHDLAVAHRCASYLDYYYILKYDEKGPDEWLRVQDAFSVQETYFWRESDQLRALTDHVLPAWFRRGRDEPLRIWSAACATGEEPYSLVIALREAGWDRHPVEIVASDASQAALAKARVGLYRERSFRALPPALRERYFAPAAGGMQLDPAIMARVAFHQINLADPEQTARFAASPVVYCRNVFIYFSPASIARVLASFARHMPPGGHLFVGASESLLKLTDDFDLHQLGDAFVYRRRPPSSP